MKYGFEAHGVQFPFPDEGGICREAGQEGVDVEILKFDVFELTGRMVTAKLFPVTENLARVIRADSPDADERNAVGRV